MSTTQQHEIPISELTDHEQTLRTELETTTATHTQHDANNIHDTLHNITPYGTDVHITHQHGEDTVIAGPETRRHDRTERILYAPEHATNAYQITGILTATTPQANQPIETTDVTLTVIPVTTNNNDEYVIKTNDGDTALPIHRVTELNVRSTGRIPDFRQALLGVRTAMTATNDEAWNGTPGVSVRDREECIAVLQNWCRDNYENNAFTASDLSRDAIRDVLFEHGFAPEVVLDVACNEYRNADTTATAAMLKDVIVMFHWAHNYTEPVNTA
jgi:hypothetical protein